MFNRKVSHRDKKCRAGLARWAATAVFVVLCTPLIGPVAVLPAEVGALALPAAAELGAPSSLAFSDAYFFSMSCPSPGNCAAVGFYSDRSDVRRGLLLSEVAGRWAPGTEAALPANAGTRPDVHVFSVSCPSPGNCAAVGQYSDRSDVQRGLLLSEVAGMWAPGTEAALPANAGTKWDVDLGSVSCASPGNCAAVGYYTDSSGSQQGLLLTEASGTWATGTEAVLPVNAAARPNAYLGSVSCPSAGDCTAVGEYVTKSGVPEGLLIAQTSGTWATGTEATLPAGAGTRPDVQLLSVSCPSPGNCAAVGIYADRSYNQQGVLLDENAGTWAAGTRAALPANAARANLDVDLSSLSCPSAGNCAAVGQYNTDRPGRPQQGLLVGETSGTWATGTEAVLPANARADPGASLYSVSCPSAGGCAAVGQYTATSGRAQGLVVTEMSGTWATGSEAVLPANAGTGPAVSLYSVSCPSPGNCAAVGQYSNSSGNQQGLVLGVTAVRARTKTALVLSAAKITYGHEQVEHLSVTVLPQYPGTTPSAVTVEDGTTTLCVITLSSGRGSCTLPAKRLGAGPHRLVATYVGGTGFDGSTSSRVILTVAV
jgi:hypothetical protein